MSFHLDDTARLELQWKRFGSQMMLDAGLFLEPEFSVGQGAYDFLRDQVTVRMVTHVLTDELPPETVTYHTSVTHEIPASTWQMWKLRHGKRWYARRFVEKWPVQYSGHPENRQVGVTATIDLERFRTYPQAPYRAADWGLGRTVLHHSIRNLRWGIDVEEQE